MESPRAFPPARPHHYTASKENRSGDLQVPALVILFMVAHIRTRCYDSTEGHTNGTREANPAE
jgi:hypothetical protein